MAYKANKSSVSDGQDKYQAQMDADTLMKHEEITSDGERHQRAADHLKQKMMDHQAAHKTARKALEKKTKGRLRKTFRGDRGQTFGEEAERETAEAEKIVGTRE